MSTEQQLETLEIGNILKLLPHRYPFLLIDRVIEIDGVDSAIGIKNVTMNEPHFTGHFPENPIMPGVLLIEGMAQTAGAICAHANSTDESVTVFFMTIDKARFRKPVRPGDVVEFHVKLHNARRNIYKYACEAKVNGVKVAEAIVSAMMAVDS